MTTRYFGFNTLAGAARSSALVKEDTTAGRFDTAYVSSAILAQSNEFIQVKQPFVDGSTSLSAAHWLRFDLYYATGGAAPPLLILNAGANAYRLQNTGSSTFQFQYWNSGTSAWVNWGSTFTLSQSTILTLVLKLTPNVGFEFYSSGVLLASSAVVPTNGAAAVDEFRFSSTGASNYFSQIMCADYDVSASHLFSSLPNANGTYTDGTGAAADVNETPLDDGTAIGLPAVGNKHTFTKAAVASIPSGLTIGGMLVNARARVGGGTVTDGKIKIRSGSTDSTSSGKGYGSIYGPKGQFFPTDPATGTNWTKTAYDAAEFGAEAA